MSATREERRQDRVVNPVVDEGGDERHPAWGLIGASRVSGGDAVLFDSEIRHNHSVVVTLKAASRKRDLNHDRLHGEEEFIQVQMSEAQWASFVSSMNSGDGVPCTIRRRDREPVAEMPYEPRLQVSMDEVRGSADESLAKVREAFEAYKDRPIKASLRTLEFAIKNAPSNMEFAAKSLTEHAENVVQKARADIEAVVSSKAKQLGLDPADLTDTRELLSGDEDEDEALEAERREAVRDQEYRDSH